ncbi:H:ACA ribonucleoprotein complex subunit 2 [Echinococcus multilocularis]|uniref:H:ACA ribonucleoprotein complex subunit 2 n=1 Tax=Echinococcus multilocularis TaxID=6211 RepID=A0A068YNH6_ECHMU|nr:H:ACA ribonucleoprotein complex subunit 2 [Echinococcus multilocularis]
MAGEVVESSDVVVESNPLSEMSYEEKLTFASVIAKPMASEKLTKRLGRLMKKAKNNGLLACGVKDSVKQIVKKKSEGILVIAGDVNPIDTVTHIPLICESHNVPYCYVPSRFDLGCTSASTVTSVCVFIRKHDSYEKLFNKCYKVVDELPLPIH